MEVFADDFSLMFDSMEPVIVVSDYRIDFPVGRSEGMLQPGLDAGIFTTMKNFGTAATGVVTVLSTSDPYLTVLNDTVGYGNMAEGTTSEGDGPFLVAVHESAPLGHLALITLTSSFDGGETVDELVLCVEKYHFLVWDASPDKSCGPVIYQNLLSLNYNGYYTGDLPIDELDRFATLYVSCGIYSNNSMILANSPEAIAITNYLNAGGSAYLEGGDVWAFDPNAGGHNFGPLFGIYASVDGAGDLYSVAGQVGTFTEGMNFIYAGENDWIDHLTATGDAFEILRNQSPAYCCGVAFDSGTYRTVGTSFELAGMTQASNGPLPLTEAIMEFLLPPDMAATGDDSPFASNVVLTPNYPNPFSDQTTFRFITPVASDVSIGLYDVSGRCVQHLFEGRASAGTQTVSIDGTKLDSGIYFIKSHSADISLSRKCVVMK